VGEAVLLALPSSQVNLLDDHLVDVLLDSAASGWNTVSHTLEGGGVQYRNNVDAGAHCTHFTHR
jgi:hypothetical protein